MLLSNVFSNTTHENVLNNKRSMFSSSLNVVSRETLYIKLFGIFYELILKTLVHVSRETVWPVF